MHACVSPPAVLVLCVISLNLLSLAQLAIGLSLQMRKLDFKKLTNPVTTTQLLLGGGGDSKSGLSASEALLRYNVTATVDARHTH